ncbi:MAG: glycosyltransferase, partial [Proteobacteria bacterium]|nr:glycosyltransferase [Pseudomonadota bacterium]
MEKYGVVEHATMLKRRFGDQEHVQISCLLEFDSPVHDSLVNIPFAATTAQRLAQCEMSFPILGGMPKKIRIKLDPTVGEARLHSFEVYAAGENGVHDLIRLAGHKRIISVAERLEINGGASTKDRAKSGPIREIAFAIPFEGQPGDSVRGLRVNLSISWPELALDLRAHRLQMERNWAKEETLGATQAELDSTQAELNSMVDQLHMRTAELNLLKSSKAWRLAEFLRRVIYRFIPPPDVGSAQALSAVEQLQRPTSAPRQRLAVALHDEVKDLKSAGLAASSDPIISVVMPVHNTPKAWLADAVGSLCAQTFPHWELVIVNDGSTSLETQEFLDEINDPRVTVFPLTRGVGISAATCMGIDASRGEYLAFMDHDDMLAPQALQKVAEKVREKNPDVLYTDESAFSDETEMQVAGYFGVPHLKPDFSPDLLLCHNYITHLLVVRKGFVDNVGGPRPEFDGAQDFDFLLRLTEKTDKIEHIAEPLYHWRQSAQSTSLDTGAKPQAHSRGARALKDALGRRGIEGEVLTANAPHFFRVRRRIIGTPSVTIIIPFRDQPRLLQKCLSSILARTRYANFQILGIDNGSVDQLTFEIKDHFETTNDRVAFLEWDKPFNFSEIVNFGVSQSPTDHVVLMNNDI